MEDIDGCAITIHPNEVAEIAEALNNKTNASTNSEESDAEEYIRKLPKLKGSKGRKKKKGENGKKKRGNKGGIVKESVNENEGHDEVIEGGDQEGGKNRVRKSTRKRKQVGKGYQEDDDEEEDEEGEGEEEEEEEELEDFNIEDGDGEVLTKKKKFQLKVKLKENEGKKMKPRGRSTRKRKDNDQNQEDDSNKGKSCEKEKDEEEDEVTTETESEDEIESDSKKLEEQKKIWKKGGWDIDPDTSFPRGPKVHMDDPSTKSELDFFIHFFPMTYLREEIIPATNSFARKNRKSWNDIMEEEMLHLFGILKAMEVYKLSERRMYWASMKDTMFPAINFSEFMTITRFEEIVKFLQLSNSPDPDKQVLDFIAVVNQHLLHALTPGKFITLDETMIKSYHKNLKGKIKIKRKPCPIGNEIKDMTDAATNIVIRLELYEGKEDIATKEHVKKFGATCATTLRLTKPLHGSGRVIIADSWFGSVKTVSQLRKAGLHAAMVVKTAHKMYPVDLLSTHKLKRGEWVSYTSEIDGVKLMATSFMDLKLKQFISTCSTSLEGQPRVTKHGVVPRPQVAEMYLRNAASIDIHNHVRTGGLGCEDVLVTDSYHMRQFAGIFGFLFTNSYLAFKKFKNGEEKTNHVNFKVKLATTLCKFQPHAPL